MAQAIIGNLHVEWGRFVKNSVAVRTDFQTPFLDLPAVILASEWPDGEVGHVETIQFATNSWFTVHSGNMASNYLVHWVAIGPA